MKHISKILMAIVSIIITIVILIIAYDRWLLISAPEPKTKGKLFPPANSLVFYPYTGGHILSFISFDSRTFQINYAKNIPSEYLIQSYDQGYFNGIKNLQKPTPKKENEFVIVLIGGSVAQGWGASRNATMVYSLLEQHLNNQGLGKKIKVINLAMGSSITYQNYVALNKWGHNLEPDMILSFAGRNDLVVGNNSKTDMPYEYAKAMGYIALTRIDRGTDLLQKACNLFEGICQYSPIMPFLRLGQVDYIMKQEFKDYEENNKKGMYSKDLLVHSLKSIKRDFEGIPIAFVLQPTCEVDIADYESLLSYVQKNTKDYENNQWYYLDMHKKWKETDLLNPQYYIPDGLHLNDKGQATATDQLTAFLTPIIHDLIDK